MHQGCIKLSQKYQAKTAKDIQGALNRSCQSWQNKALLWQMCHRRLCREYPGLKCELSEQESWPCVVPFVLRVHFHPAQEERPTPTPLKEIFCMNKLFKSPAGYHETNTAAANTNASPPPLPSRATQEQCGVTGSHRTAKNAQKSTHFWL